MDPDTAGVTPVVSVVMTVHGTPAALLAAAVRSVLDQTLEALELVVVVDSEPAEHDGAALDSLTDDRRLIVTRPGRLGRGRALNLAVELASSELIAVQDADDASHPERLERQVAALSSHAEIGLLGSAVRRTTDLEAPASWPLPPPSAPSPIGDRILATNPLVHSSVVMRRAAFDEVSGYSVSRRWQLDYDLYLRLRQSGVPLGVLREPLVLKRLHDDQYFENSGQDFERLWSAYRLQLAQVRRERPERRVAYGALASGRLISRTARQLARARRRRAPAD